MSLGHMHTADDAHESIDAAGRKLKVVLEAAKRQKMDLRDLHKVEVGMAGLEDLMAKIRAALDAAITAQVPPRVWSGDPVYRIFELLAEGFRLGVCHVAMRNGSAPADGPLWGWSPLDPVHKDCHSKGDLVGYLEIRKGLPELLLMPQPIIDVARKMNPKGAFNGSANALVKLVHARNLLLRTGSERQRSKMVQLRVGPHSQQVMVISPANIHPELREEPVGTVESFDLNGWDDLAPPSSDSDDAEIASVDVAAPADKPPGKEDALPGIPGWMSGRSVPSLEGLPRGVINPIDDPVEGTKSPLRRGSKQKVQELRKRKSSAVA